jgi:hypothetical protein
VKNNWQWMPWFSRQFKKTQCIADSSRRSGGVAGIYVDINQQKFRLTVISLLQIRAFDTGQ